MRDIWLIRHCEPVKGVVGVCLGRRGDPPLSEAGLACARELGTRFAASKLDNVYCSPLLRSRQTAEHIGSCQMIPDLIEQDYGTWDGMAWPDIKERFPELYAARSLDNSLVPPDAETCAQAAARYERALLTTQGRCAAVAHKGAMGALLCRLLGKNPAELWTLDIPYGCCILLHEHGGRLEVDQAPAAFPAC